LISWSSSTASSRPDVGEGDLGLVLGDDLGTRLAEAHDPAAAALELPEHPHEHQGEEHEREQRVEQADPCALHLVVGVQVGDPGVDEILGDAGRVGRREVDGVLGAVLQLAGDRMVLVVDRGGLHLAGRDLAGEGVERQRLGFVGAQQGARHEEGDDGQDHDADDGAATLLAQEEDSGSLAAAGPM